MKSLLQIVAEWFHAKTADTHERYLAQSVDACDFEVRAQALERAGA
ncbi:MAG: hypothetical protein Q7T07_08530 [Burkholderiaceae bacterium]|nr:hypothetical protein [Burkholderiaceae bacterium]